MTATETNQSQVYQVPTRRIPVTRILCPNPGMMTGPGTNSYLIGSKRRVLLDPGPDIAAHRQRILSLLGDDVLDSVLVTHTHGDHSPGALAFQQATGARLIGCQPSPESQHQDETFVADLEPIDEQMLDIDGVRIQAIHTPGHVGNHVCWYLPAEALLFTGDHILEGTMPVILPPDGDMAAYLSALRRIQGMQCERLAPGHGQIIEQPDRVIQHVIDHRLAREEKIFNALQASGEALTVEALVRNVYQDVSPSLWPWAAKTLLAHLIKLAAEQRISHDQKNDEWKAV